MGILKRLSFWYKGARSNGVTAPPSPSRVMTPDEMLGGDRQRMDATTWDMSANQPTTEWMVDIRNSILSNFNILVRTKDPELNRSVMRMWETWKMPEHSHAFGRLHFDDLFALHEGVCVKDGDALIVWSEGCKIQVINGSSLYQTGSKRVVREGVTDTGLGIYLDDEGFISHYLYRTAKGEKVEIEASRVLWDGYMTDPERQIRGVTPLAPAIRYLSTTDDIYMANLNKLKLEGTLGLIIKSDPQESNYREQVNAFGQNGGTSTPTEEQKNAAYKDMSVLSRFGIWVKRIMPGDDVKAFESSNPSANAQQMLQTALAMAFKSLSIPFSFHDATKYGYPAIKLEVGIMERKLALRKAQRRRLINAIFKTVLAYYFPELTPAQRAEIERETYWISPPGFWLDEKQQAEAAKLRITSGLSNFDFESILISGIPFEDNVAALARQQKLIRDLKVDIYLGQPGQSSVGEEETPSNNPTDGGR